MNQLDILAQQRNVLLAALKQIATNNRTPGWIIDVCRNAAKKARDIKTQEEDPFDMGETKVAEKVVFSPGKLVRNIDKTDKTTFSLLEVSMELDGVKLWNIKAIDGPNAGVVVHNVPETKFRGV